MAGNKNSGRQHHEKPFIDALMMEIKSSQDDHKRLRRIARKLLDEAETGNMQAIKEVADRLDGKAVQQQILSGDQDAPLNPIITVNLRKE